MFDKVLLRQLRALCSIPWEPAARAVLIVGAATALGETIWCWLLGQQSHFCWITNATHASKVTDTLKMLTLVGCTLVNLWLGGQKATDDVFQNAPTNQPK